MNDVITLDYGSGGEKTAELIDGIFRKALSNPILDELSDAAALPALGEAAFSTDSFVVEPLIFPGGDIGKLSVCGTVNDLLVSGAEPEYLSLSAIIEEGFSAETLRRIVASVRKTADLCGVSVVTGDTKVVPGGKGDGLYLNTAGIGRLMRRLSPRDIRKGDVILASGDLGRHGMAVMLARHEMGLFGEMESDCAPVLCARELWTLPDLRVLRDPTRGGIATTLCEFVEGGPLTFELEEDAVPVREDVRAACGLLGIDPLYSACEGRILAIVGEKDAQEALHIMQAHDPSAAIIGRVTENHPGRLILRTKLGAERVLTRLAGAQLPRIC